MRRNAGFMLRSQYWSSFARNEPLVGKPRPNLSITAIDNIEASYRKTLGCLLHRLLLYIKNFRKRNEKECSLISGWDSVIDIVMFDLIVEIPYDGTFLLGLDFEQIGRRQSFLFGLFFNRPAQKSFFMHVLGVPILGLPLPLTTIKLSKSVCWGPFHSGSIWDQTKSCFLLSPTGEANYGRRDHLIHPVDHIDRRIKYSTVTHSNALLLSCPPVDTNIERTNVSHHSPVLGVKPPVASRHKKSSNIFPLHFICGLNNKLYRSTVKNISPKQRNEIRPEQIYQRKLLFCPAPFSSQSALEKRAFYLAEGE